MQVTMVTSKKCSCHVGNTDIKVNTMDTRTELLFVVSMHGKYRAKTEYSMLLLSVMFTPIVITT